MRTRAKQKHVASDRARRENVPRHILFHVSEEIVSYETKTLAWMHVWREERQLPEQVYLGKGLQETEYL